MARRQKLVKIMLGLLAGLVLLIIMVVAGVTLFMINTRVQQFLSKQLRRDVTLAENISFHWGWPVTIIQARGIDIGNFPQGSRPQLLTAEQANISIDLRSLLRGQLYFPIIDLKKPDVLLEKDAEGNPNWKFGSGGGSAAVATVAPSDRTQVPKIGRLTVTDGKLAHKDPAKKIDLALTVETLQGSTDQQVNLVGNGSVLGQPLKINLQGASLEQLQDKSHPYPAKIALRVGNSMFEFDGEMQEPLNAKGISGKVTVNGANAADLYDITRIVLPPTPPYRLTGQLRQDGEIWHFTDFSGHLGNSDLAGNLSFDAGRERPLLQGKLLSNKLNFADLGNSVGIKQNAAKTDEPPTPFVLPDMPLAVERLSAMDADIEFTGKQLISSDLPMDDFYVKASLADRILKLTPVRFGTARGNIIATVTVNAQNEPVTVVSDVSFQKLVLGPMFAGLAKTLDQPNEAEGYIGGAAKLSGTGKSLREIMGNANGDIGLGMEGGQISQLVVELLGLNIATSLGLYLEGDKPANVRCVIGDFQVASGLMTARQLIIDTDLSNVKGQGTIDLGTEQMDLTFTARGKQTRVLSLNSPIRITGTFKEPDVGVKAKDLGIRGVLAAAATALFPVLGLAATIEPSFGEDSNCAQLIRQTEENSGQGGNDSKIPQNR